jgi:putative nucleotidyltransferase with HDIG domain
MPDSRTPKSLKNLFGGFQRSAFRSFSDFFYSAFFGWLIFGILVFGISLTLSFHVDYLPPNIKVGKVAPKDIKADQNYEIIDERATEINREEALQSIPRVFDYQPAVAADLDARVREAFAGGRSLAAQGAGEDALLQHLWKTLGLQPSADQLRGLVADKFSVETENFLRQILQDTESRFIVVSRDMLPVDDKGGVTVRNLDKRSPENEFNLKDLKKIRSIAEVQTDLLDKAVKFPRQKGAGLSTSQVFEVASRMVSPNLNYNSVETELRRAKAVSAVRSVIIKVQTGEAIVRSGDRYEPHHVAILEGIRKQKSETNFLIRLGGTILFVSLLLLITYAFSKRYIRKFNPTRDDLYFLGGVLILLLLSVRLAAAASTVLRDIFPYDVSVQALYYAIPVAAGAMLTRYILNSEIALVFAIVASALTGIFLEGDLDLSIYYLISSIAAAAAVAHVDRRSAILKAGVLVGVVNALVILAIKLITVVSVTTVFNLPQVLINVSLGFLGGLLTAIFVMVLAPIAELIFNYVTDIKLLELGNLNHPLLREMIVKAPGTYHHSQLVAVLAEAAAAEIGANPLLARVGSYFHDIGKMRKPSYFIENQQNGVNLHDKLSPSMSALVISSHVKDGVELAREYKLPQRIVDFIPQHQGTKLITFFYNKAVEMNPDTDMPVDEKKYRYPGPPPQNRESGIILLADGVEAAVRSLSEKNPQKIAAMVQKIINKNFAEAQLDECDMTLRDLHVIAETFTNVLVGIYHHRIEYPEIEEKKATVTPIKDIIGKK